jgi:hypothetical protein
VSSAFRDLAKLLKSGKVLSGTQNFNFATRNQLQNFFRSEAKPSVSKIHIKPFPMIEDGLAYIVMQTQGQPANLAATRSKAQGVRWQKGADTLVYYGLNLATTGQKLRDIVEAGIQISNIKELKHDFTKLKLVKLMPGDPAKM